MEATINVKIGLTDSLERLATEALRIWETGKTPTAPEPQKPQKPQKPEKPEPQKPEPEPLDLENVEPPKPEPQPEPEPEPERATPVELPPGSAPADAQPVPPPDDETLRTLLDICITRWAGQGSESSKDPKILLKRKDVCSCFKQIARHLGAEKPTKLQGDARLKFLYEIENNIYQEGDRIVWGPF